MQKTHKIKYMLKRHFEGEDGETVLNTTGSVVQEDGYLLIRFEEELEENITIKTAVKVYESHVQLSRSGDLTMEQKFELKKQHDGEYRVMGKSFDLHVYTHALSLENNTLSIRYTMFVGGEDLGMFDFILSYKKRGVEDGTN